MSLPVQLLGLLPLTRDATRVTVPPPFRMPPGWTAAVLFSTVVDVRFVLPPLKLATPAPRLAWLVRCCW